MHKKERKESEVAQSCPTLCDPMDYSLPGSSVHGIFQARVLEWGALAFSASITRLYYFALSPAVCEIVGLPTALLTECCQGFEFSDIWW